MRVAIWGSSLAVRLPADLVRELGLKKGGQIDLVKGDGTILVRRQPGADEVLQGLGDFAGNCLRTRVYAATPPMSAEFADTTVVLYPIDDDPNAERTVEILRQGPRASAQVLTEAMVNCRRKTRLS